MALTPFHKGAAAIDHESLRRHVSSMVDDGVSGLVALGVIAEPSALSREERADALDAIIEAAGDRPVVATAMTSDPDQRAAELRGIIAPRSSRLAGLMLPVSSPDPRVVASVFTDAHRATGLPLWVQDYPNSTGVHIEVESLLEVLARVATIRGVKCEAAPTFLRIRRLAAERPDLLLLSGLGGSNLIEDLVAGARGVASGISRPRALVEAASAWAAEDLVGARTALGAIAGLVGIETQAGTSIAIRKEHWRRRGVIASADVRPSQLPYPSFLSEISEELGYPLGTTGAG
ncbi:dihydrodipicolinate synthase family protein [Nocardioides sp. AN3]